MMMRSFLTVLLVMLGGCSTMELNMDSVGVLTEEYGQCIANTKVAPTFNNNKVTFICQDDRVLLGQGYKKDGKDVIDSAILLKKGKKYFIREKSQATIVRGLHSVCQIQPMKGNGELSIKRYYFDEKLKRCRPFEWSGKGGIVPFDGMDECEQYCYD